MNKDYEGIDEQFFKKNPFAGAPGLRAAYFRYLYEFGMFLKRRNDRAAPEMELFEREQARREQWSRQYASPRADSLVNIFLWTLALLVIGLILAPRQPHPEPTKTTPAPAKSAA